MAGGRITIEDGRIAAVDLDDEAPNDGPYLAPGFVDVHVHGWGGHDAMGDAGRARRHGSPAVATWRDLVPADGRDRADAELVAFAERVRTWLPDAPADGAEPLGFNLEGPFLAPARQGRPRPGPPSGTGRRSGLASLEPLVDGLRLLTDRARAARRDGPHPLAPRAGVATSIGHSAATFEEARAGYDAGATSTTHLFNAMSGVDHRAPGLAVAALLDDAAYVELIADGIHVHPALWPLITRLKPADRLLLVSDAIALAGMGDGRGRIGGLDVEVVGRRVTLAGTSTLAGSVIALDTAVRNLVAIGRGAAGRRRRGRPQPAGPARHHGPGPDRGRASGPTSSSSTRSSGSAGSCGPAPGSRATGTESGRDPD